MQPRTSRVEWPTIVVAIAVYGGWLALLGVHRHLPLVVLLAVLGVLAVWHGSLQHEVIHGHPTPWPLANTAIALPPIALWMPFRAYRTSHLRHHASPLTVPGDDPESFYVSPAHWAAAGTIRRAYWRATRTLVGRLTLGAAVRPISYWCTQSRECTHNIVAARQAAGHAIAATVVLVIAVGVAGIPAWTYVVGVGFVGTALTMMRSFAEHRAVDGASQSAVVRSGRFFGLLYLNNNLHHTHHIVPSAPWYALPSLTVALGADDVAAAGAGLYGGYGEVWRRYAFHPLSPAVHPVPVDAAG